MTTEEWNMRKAAMDEVNIHLSGRDEQTFNKPIVVDNGDLKGAILNVRRFASGEFRCLFEVLVNNEFIRFYQPLGCFDTKTLITVACHP